MTLSPTLRRLALPAAALLSLTAAPALAADCGGAISFAPGTSGATVKGRLAGLETCDYRLSARKGQVLRAGVDGGKLDVITVARSNTTSRPSRSWSLTATAR